MGRKSKSQQQIEILERIKKRVKDWFTYYSESNDRFRRDVKFVYEKDGQWEDDEIHEFRQDKRPYLTFNMLPKFINNLTGEFADNVPQPTVRSRDAENTNQQQIDLLTGLLRQIAFASRNDVVYQTAFKNALIGGYGALRVATEPEGVDSFNQVVRYDPVFMPTLCFWDPLARSPDKGDGQYCGVSQIMPKKEFKLKYPEVELPSSADFAIFGTDNFQWITEEGITIVDYYEKQPFKKKIALLTNNIVVDSENADAVILELNKNAKLVAEQSNDPFQPFVPVKIDQEKVVEDFKIKFYRVIANQILEEENWDGKKLPIIFQPGLLVWIDGREQAYSLIHYIRDAQRAYNYSRTEYLYRLKLTRYERFLTTATHTRNYESAWKNAHLTKSRLPYNYDREAGAPIVLPSQEIPQSLLQEMERDFRDIQAIPGRFEASMGAPGNETSGIAIANRQRPNNFNVKVYFDNARMAIESGSNVVMDLIPTIYDTDRIITIRRENGQTENIHINDKGGELNQIVKGRLSVEVRLGSSFALQQTEAVAQLTKFAASNPAVAQVTPDLIAENLDLKNTPQLVDRIRRNVIPQIAAQEGDKDPIIQQNLQATQQKQHTQQQVAQLQMQKLQAEVTVLQENTKLLHSEQVLDGLKAQNDQIRAMSTRLDAMANMLNAQTNRMESETKGVEIERKAEAEEQKAELGLQTAVVKALQTTRGQ